MREIIRQKKRDLWIAAKFTACTSRILPSEQREKIVNAVASFEEISDLRAFMALLEA